MTDIINDYNTQLKLTLSTYKPKINIFINNDILDNYLIEITDIIDFLSKAKANDIYFIKSFLLLLFPFDTYITHDSGKLLKNSLNCDFTISDIAIKNKDYRFFNKIVKYETQTLFHNVDLLIIDILASIIFKYILSLSQNKKFSKIIPKYQGSVLSYVRQDISTSPISQYWNYNELNYRHVYSPYNPSNITNDSLLSPYYNGKKTIVIMYDAIKSPISVGQIFKNYKDDQTSIINKSKILDIFDDACNLYDFIKEIGIKYGFMHNDLHMNNVIYDNITRKLVLIDFGRCSFKKFMDNPVSEIDNELKSEFIKLNYDKLLSINVSNINVNQIYGNKDLYYKHLSVMGNNGKYFGGIYDLITFALNMYIRFLYFMSKESPIEYEIIKEKFSSIIEIVIDDNNVDNLILHNLTLKLRDDVDDFDILLSNYLKLKFEYIQTFESEKTKRFYIMLLEGLFYYALLILYNGCDNTKLIYKYFQVIDKTNERFRDFIFDDILSYPNYATKLSSDSFFMNFINISGGKVCLRKKSYIHEKPNKDYMLLKPNTFSLFENQENYNLAITNEKEITLEETSNAYQELFEDLDEYNLKTSKTSSVKKGGSKRLLKKY